LSGSGSCSRGGYRACRKTSGGGPGVVGLDRGDDGRDGDNGGGDDNDGDGDDPIVKEGKSEGFGCFFCGRGDFYFAIASLSRGRHLRKQSCTRLKLIDVEECGATGNGMWRDVSRDSLQPHLVPYRTARSGNPTCTPSSSNAYCFGGLHYSPSLRLSSILSVAVSHSRMVVLDYGSRCLKVRLMTRLGVLLCV
jgi:hypothetical protein